MLLPRLLKKHPRVIVSYRNSGFGDNLLAAASAWRYAKNTNRALVICWRFSRYLADKSENAFSRFFKVPESIEGVPVIAEPRIDSLSALLIIRPYYIYPDPDPLSILYMLLSNLHLPFDSLLRKRVLRRHVLIDSLINDSEDVNESIIITHGCYVPNDNLKPFFDSLELRPELQQKADEFAHRYFRNKKVIGVHIRYYNERMPRSDHTRYWQDQVQALCLCLNKIKEAEAKVNHTGYVIFLSTDSRLVRDFIAGAVKNVVIYEKLFGSDISKELHRELPVETAEATLIEMFLLARSDILVRFPPGSWFSHYASLYAKEIIA
ncbi:MAG: nodulation protein NodZ [Thermodesulfobacteriota bacterium]